MRNCTGGEINFHVERYPGSVAQFMLHLLSIKADLLRGKSRRVTSAAMKVEWTGYVTVNRINGSRVLKLSLEIPAN